MGQDWKRHRPPGKGDLLVGAVASDIGRVGLIDAVVDLRMTMKEVAYPEYGAMHDLRVDCPLEEAGIDDSSEEKDQSDQDCF